MNSEDSARKAARAMVIDFYRWFPNFHDWGAVHIDRTGKIH